MEPLAQREQSAFVVLTFGKPSHAVLDHDDRAIDDETEVERAQRHQVAGDTERVHASRHHQRRQRDDERRDKRCAEVAEEDK